MPNPFMNSIKLFLCFVLTYVSPNQLRAQSPPLTKNNTAKRIFDAFINAELYDINVSDLLDSLDHTPLEITNKVALARLTILRARKKLDVYDFHAIDSLSNQAIKLSKETNDTLSLVIANACIGVTYNIKNDYPKAIQYINIALSYVDQKNDFISQMIKTDLHYNLASFYLKNKEYKSSISHGKKSLQLIQLLHEKANRVPFLNSFIAKSLTLSGQHNEAQQYLTNINDNHPRAAASLWETQARLFAINGDFQQAYKHLRTSLEYKQREINGKILAIRRKSLKEANLDTQLDKMQAVKIKAQNRQIIASLTLGFAIFIGLLINLKLNRTLQAGIKEINALNKKLQESVNEIEVKNTELHVKNNEINRLLKLEEKTLFSKVLRISTQVDTAQKLSSYIEQLIDNNKTITNKELSTIQDTMLSFTESDIWKDFEMQFEKTRPFFFRNLKKIAPDLSVKDLKHCAYIISKLNSKEVAHMINISPRSVETTRYRIKKKLNLAKNQNIYDFLLTI